MINWKREGGHMKRLFLMGLAIMLTSACGKDTPVDPQPEPHPLVGTWQSSDADITGLRDALKTYLTGELTRNGVENPEAVAENLVAIMTDSVRTALNYRIEIKDNATWTDSNDDTGTWRVQTGNTLVLTDAVKGHTETYIYSISGQRLTLSVRKADFIRMLTDTAEDESDLEDLRIFSAVLAETADSAEVMKLHLTRI